MIAGRTYRWTIRVDPATITFTLTDLTTGTSDSRSIEDSTYRGNYYGMMTWNTTGNLDNVLVEVVQDEPLYVTDPVTHHVYGRIPGSLNWEESRLAAEGMEYDGRPGHLVTLTSQEEQEFVWSSLSQPLHYYIGAHQGVAAAEPSWGWSWVTGESFSFNGWAAGKPDESQPDEDYAQFGVDGGWNDCRDDTGGDAPGMIVEFDASHDPQFFRWHQNDHYYGLVATDLRLSEARDLAETMMHEGLPGYLATLQSQEEQDFIFATFPDAKLHFFGAYQPSGSIEPDGGWSWVTDEPWVWSNWSSSEPSNTGGNEDGVAFHSDGSWNDWNTESVPASSDLKDFIIEFGDSSILTEKLSFGGLKSRY